MKIMSARFKYLLFTTLLCIGACGVQAQTGADSHAALVAEMAMKTLWKEDPAAGPRPKKWTYDQAVVLVAVEGLWYRTGNPAYFEYMQQSMDRFVGQDGTIETYKQEDFNIDNVACGRILLA